MRDKPDKESAEALARMAAVGGVSRAYEAGAAQMLREQMKTPYQRTHTPPKRSPGGQWLVMRHAVLMEDEGWDQFCGRYATKADAAAAIEYFSEGDTGYFKRSDYYIALAEQGEA